MDKTEIVKVLAAFSPPLSSAQVEEASDKVAELIAKEIESPRKEESIRKSRR